MKIKILWLDDRRSPFDKEWRNYIYKYIFTSPPFDIVWVKSYDEFVDWINNNGLPNQIFFDNDLGDVDLSKIDYREKTGFTCAKWLVEYCLDNKTPMPKFHSQSSNPEGKKDIETLLSNFVKHQNGE